MSKHTPGPWRFEKWDDPPTADGIVWPNWSVEADVLNAGEGGIVCELPAPSRGYPERDAEVDANARLIAAAPELLGALRKAVMRLGHGGQALADGTCNYTACALCQARAAIAKAEGKP